MTPQEQFKKEMQMPVSAYHKGFAFTEEYVLWLEKRLLAAETKHEFDHLIDEASKTDVCPKCGSEDIITTIYCNKCKEAH